MSIDWQKVSELLFEAILQGSIGAIIVYITFRLGKRESDRNWQRELGIFREERQTSKNLRYIEAIQKVIELEGIFKPKIVSGVALTEEELSKIRPEILKAQSVFENSGNPRVKYYLRGLNHLSFRQSPEDIEDIEKRTDLLDKMIDGLNTELTAFESSLYQTEDKFLSTEDAN